MWKLYSIVVATLVTQIGILLLGGITEWLKSPQAPLQAALAIFGLGCLGCVLIWLLRRNNVHDNTKAEMLVRWVGAMVATGGIFLSIIPLMAVLTHGVLEAVILVTGVALAPALSGFLPAGKATTDSGDQV